MTHRNLGGREPRYMRLPEASREAMRQGGSRGQENARKSLLINVEQGREFARRWKEEGRYTEARYFEYCFHHTERRLAYSRPAIGHIPFDFSKDAA